MLLLDFSGLCSLEFYLIWSCKEKLAVFTSYSFADSQWRGHFSFAVWKQSKILAHIHKAWVNREGSILSTSTVTSNLPFCTGSRVPSSGIFLSWSWMKYTQNSLQYNEWFQQSAFVIAWKTNEPNTVVYCISDISYSKDRSSDSVCTDLTLFIYIW